MGIKGLRGSFKGRRRGVKMQGVEIKVLKDDGDGLKSE